MADYLTRHGIAVLRVDDRSVGGSTGDMSKATSADFVGDVLAGIEFLSSQPEIDAKKIGLIGHSEGGVIAPMVAAKSDKVAFAILLAGTGVPGREVLRAQSELIDVAMGMTTEEAKAETADQDAIFELFLSGAEESVILAKMREVGERQLTAAEASSDPKKRDGAKAQRATLDATIKQQYKQFSSPWLAYFLKLDPRDALRKTRCPVLALNGEKDLQVPPKQNLPEIDKALREGGNKEVTTKELPGLNHLFQHCTSGSPAEYAEIEETCSPEVLAIMAEWIRSRSGLPVEAATEK
jgi:pimeloyl-ACP methyl ester carboxylesterase